MRWLGYFFIFMGIKMETDGWVQVDTEEGLGSVSYTHLAVVVVVVILAAIAIISVLAQTPALI